MPRAWVDYCKMYHPEFKCYGRLALLAHKAQDDHYLDLLMMTIVFARKWLTTFEGILREWLYFAQILTIVPAKKCNMGEDERNAMCLAFFSPTFRRSFVCQMETLQKDVCWQKEHFYKEDPAPFLLERCSSLQNRGPTVYKTILFKHINFLAILVTHHIPRLHFGRSQEHLIITGKLAKPES